VFKDKASADNKNISLKQQYKEFLAKESEHLPGYGPDEPEFAT
jgi:hypothetical protein